MAIEERLELEVVVSCEVQLEWESQLVVNSQFESGKGVYRKDIVVVQNQVMSKAYFSSILLLYLNSTLGGPAGFESSQKQNHHNSVLNNWYQSIIPE